MHTLRQKIKDHKPHQNPFFRNFIFLLPYLKKKYKSKVNI